MEKDEQLVHSDQKGENLSTLSRRRLLKIGAAAIVTAASSSSIYAVKETFGENIEADRLEAFWHEPSNDEVDIVISEIEQECSKDFSYEVKPYSKNGIQLIDFTTYENNDDSTKSNVVAVLKEGLTAAQAKGVIIYNHSIEGANVDIDKIGDDLKMWIDEGNMVIFTLNSISGVQKAKESDDDFFVIEENDTKINLMDSDRNLANFSTNSPAKNLRGICAVFEEYPDLMSKTAEIIGFSMGASTTISQLAFWNKFREKYFLPQISQVGIYAPISSLFKKEVIKDLWKSNGKLGDIGVFSVVKAIIRHEVSKVLTYWDERISYSKQPRNLVDKQSGITLPVAINLDESRSMFTDITLSQEQVDGFMKDKTPTESENPNVVVYFYDSGDNRTGEKPKLFEETVRFAPKDQNEFADFSDLVRKKYESINLRFKNDRELLTALSKENRELIKSIRQTMIKFSPSILLDGMKRRGYKFPIQDVTILRSELDTIVPPRQTFALMDKLKELGVKVDEQKSLMGHYINIEIKSFIGRLRRKR